MYGVQANRARLKTFQRMLKKSDGNKEHATLNILYLP